MLFFLKNVFFKPGCRSQREAGLVDKVRSVSPPGTGSAQRSTCKTMYLNYPITQKFLKILFAYFSFWTTWMPLSLNSFSPQLRALQGTLAGGGADGRSIETSLSGCNWDIFWKLSKTKIYIKCLLLWVQFKHRVGKIAHRAHWSRGIMPENFIPLFSNEEKKTCVEWKPSILIWPRCRSWRFPLSVPGSKRRWLMISRRWALEEWWLPNLINQLTNSGKEGWDQSSGRVTSWIRKSYPLLINLPHLVVKHVLVLAALQHILRKLDLHLLSSSSLFDLLLHEVVVPSNVSRHIINDWGGFIFQNHLNGNGWGLSIFSS